MDQTTDRIVIGCSSVEQLINSLDTIQNERTTNTIETENEINEKNYLNKLYQDISQFSPNYYY